MLNNIIYEGMDVLKCAPGSVLRVLESVNNKGDILLRVDSQRDPFFSLYKAPNAGTDNYHWWGDALEGYTFEYLGHVLDREFASKPLII